MNKKKLNNNVVTTFKTFEELKKHLTTNKNIKDNDICFEEDVPLCGSDLGSKGLTTKKLYKPAKSGKKS